MPWPGGLPMFARQRRPDAGKGHFTAEAICLLIDPVAGRRYYFTLRRGVAQSGSASGLGPEGRMFESSRPDQFYKIFQRVRLCRSSSFLFFTSCCSQIAVTFCHGLCIGRRMLGCFPAGFTSFDRRILYAAWLWLGGAGGVKGKFPAG